MVQNPDLVIKLVTDYIVTIKEFDELAKELSKLLKKYPFLLDFEILWPERFKPKIESGTVFTFVFSDGVKERYKVINRISEMYWKCHNLDWDYDKAILEYDIIQAIMLEVKDRR